MSDTPVCGYTYDQMATDISQIVRQLRLQKFILAGFSMRGAIALRNMNRFKGNGVCKLILLSAAAPCFARRFDFPYGKPVDEVNALINLAETDRPQLCQNFSRQLFACPHSEAVIDWFRDIALPASGIGTIKSCIHGDKDLVVSKELAEIQHQSICGSKLITLADSGHGIIYDRLDQFNSIFMNAIND